jgi:hypothetical protein
MLRRSMHIYSIQRYAVFLSSLREIDEKSEKIVKDLGRSVTDPNGMLY